MNYEEYMLHFGVKGMKWGVRKKKDQINSRDRIIKEGTTIQNISSGEFKKSDRHIYGAYTSHDKVSYTNLIANLLFNEKGYMNEFKVKKDIKIPSDKKLVETFTAIAKANPKQVAKDMTSAYNSLAVFTEKSVKHYEKKISKVKDANTKRGEKLTKEFIKIMVSDKAAKTRAEFFGALIKQGYDGISDVKDRDTIFGKQDPLIIFNPNKSLDKVKSVKLTKDDLDRYSKIMSSKQFNKSRKDLSEVQR